MNICDNIAVKEIVCPHVWAKYGDNAIRFIDPMLIQVLDVIRNKIIKSPMLINNGKTLTQRGLRCNLCQLVEDKTKGGKLYLSAHSMGKACDFSCKGRTVEQIHELIMRNANILPCKIRLESVIDSPNWCHVDIMTHGQKEIVHIFRA